MQIHYYDQWDKLSNKKLKSNTDKGITFTEGNKIQLFLIAVGVVTTFVFSYLIFSVDYGQAGTHQQAAVFKPENALYTVQKGDTLWSIAVQHYPEISQEEAIERIQQKNGFQGTTIHAGQTILLP